MITVLDDHNLIVTTGSARIDGDPHVIALTAADAAALLDFYFARGGHHVVVDLGGVRLQGCIETRWDGQQRHWLIRTDAPVLKSDAPAISLPLAS
jgi:hypothetical protein